MAQESRDITECRSAKEKIILYCTVILSASARESKQKDSRKMDEPSAFKRNNNAFNFKSTSQTTRLSIMSTQSCLFGMGKLGACILCTCRKLAAHTKSNTALAEPQTSRKTITTIVTINMEC